MMKRTNRGFTLVELMVTVGIFVFMTALILWRYGSFSNGALLTNLAYDVAISIHQAQTYGLSVRATDTGGAFGSAYGLDFRKTTAGGFSNTVYAFFSDGTAASNWNGVYDCSGNALGSSCGNGDSIISLYTMKSGAHIKDLCVGDYNATCTGADHVDISFRRPDPTAHIFVDSNEYNVVKIVVISADGNSTRTITVNRAGQIAVKE